jgi:nucleoside-diphosphate-sugar epimerase
MQTRDFVSVEDVARANLLALGAAGRGCRCLNICTGRETSIGGLLGLFARSFGFEGLPESGPPRAGEIKRSVGNPARAKEEIGFTAGVTIDRGIQMLCGTPAEPFAAGKS